ncbi:hypothetical protein BDV30DRAFT_243777 [Aspergillus minisclerotigenes]|uniref:Uncharacterized protein n=1 Tax=Aspergillus minisclerotigenes TaxID=656917 RepID=A0A5N6IPB3_9EURO|nr:hypothetical protein BDV30DRAFT_243777 [Aspergillus minisclerotigenes]
MQWERWINALCGTRDHNLCDVQQVLQSVTVLQLCDSALISQLIVSRRDTELYNCRQNISWLWVTNRRHFLQADLIPAHVQELRTAVSENVYNGDKHGQQLTGTSHTDLWFPGILSKGNGLYIAAQHKWRNGPASLAMGECIKTFQNVQKALHDEVEDQLSNMKEAVEQA